MVWNGRNESILGSKPIVATTVVDAALSGLGEAATVERTSSSSTSTTATSVAVPSNNTALPPPPATKAPLVNAWSRPLIKKDTHHEEGKDAIVEKIPPLVLDGESSSNDKENGGVALTATPSPTSTSVSPLGRIEDKKTFSPKNTTTVESSKEDAKIVVVEVIPPLPPPPKMNAWGRKDNHIIRKQQDEQQAKEQQQRQSKEQDEATNSTVSTAGSFSDAVDNSIGNNALDDSKDAEVSHITTPSVLEGNTVVTTTNMPSTLAGMAVEDVVVVECSSPTPPPSDISSSDNQQQQHQSLPSTTTETRKNTGGKKKNKNKSSSVVAGTTSGSNNNGSSNNGSSIDVSNGNHTNSGWGTKNYKKNNHNGGHQQHHNNNYQNNHHHQHQSSRLNNPSTTTHYQQQHQQHPSQYAPLQQRAGYRHPPTTTSAYNYNNSHPTVMMMNAAAPTFVPAAKRAFDPYKAKAIQLAKEAQDHEDRSTYFGSVEMNTDVEEKVDVEIKVVEEEVVVPNVDPPFFSIDVECIATGYGSCARGINDGCGNAGRHGKDVPPIQYNDYSHRYPGRVALVDNDGNVLANIVIRPPNDGAGVTSYLTDLTGLTSEICLSPDAVPLDDAIRTIKTLLASDGVIVGQAIGHDVTWLGLSPGKDFDRTVDICDIFRQRLPAVLTEAGDIVKKRTESGNDNEGRLSLLDKSSDDYLGFKTRYRHFSLRHVCLNLLGTDMQGGVHDPVADARYSLMLFHKYRHSSPTQLRIVRDGLHRAPVTPGFAAEKTPVIDGVCVSAAGYNYKRAARKIWRWYSHLNTTRDRC